MTRRHHPPPITILQSSPGKHKHRYCWQCFYLSSERCPNPNTTFNNEACLTFIPDPQPHCPKCHATGGTIQSNKHHRGKHTYTYYRMVHYDPSKASKYRYCYLGKTLPPGLQQKLREGNPHAHP